MLQRYNIVSNRHNDCRRATTESSERDEPNQFTVQQYYNAAHFHYNIIMYLCSGRNRVTRVCFGFFKKKNKKNIIIVLRSIKTMESAVHVVYIQSICSFGFRTHEI